MIHRDFLLHGTVRLKPEAREKYGIVWCVFPGLSPMELVGGTYIIPNSTSAIVNASSLMGPGAENTNTANPGVIANRNPELTSITKTWTVLFMGELDGYGAYAGFLEADYRDAGGSPYTVISIQRDASLTSLWANYSYGSGTQAFIQSDSGALDTSGAFTMVGAEVDLNSGVVNFIKDGKPHGAAKSTTTGRTLDWSGNATKVGVLNGTDGRCFCGIICNRVLGAQHYAELWADPTAILEPEDTFAAWMASGGGGGGPITVDWEAATIALAGQGFLGNRAQQFARGQVALTGQGFQSKRTVVFSNASIAVTGKDWDKIFGPAVLWDAGSIAFSGQGFTSARRQIMGAGSVALSGLGFLGRRTVALANAAIALTGRDFTVQRAFSVAWLPGAIAFTGRAFDTVSVAVTAGVRRYIGLLRNVGRFMNP